MSENDSVITLKTHPVTYSPEPQCPHLSKRGGDTLPTSQGLLVNATLQCKQTFSESTRSLSFDAGPAEYFPACVIAVVMLFLPAPKGDIPYDGAR